MSTRLNGEFEITSSEESTYDTFGDGGKLTRVEVEASYEGDLQGTASVEYLMAYAGKESARFVGQQRFKGDAGDRTGSVVLQLSGTFDGSTVNATSTVVSGTGTGDFAGMEGRGSFSAPLGEAATYVLDATFGDTTFGDATGTES